MNEQHQNLASDRQRVAVFPVGPFQVVTLLDMLEFYAYSFYLFISKFDAAVCLILQKEEDRGPQSPARDDELNKVRYGLASLSNDLKKAGVESLKATTKRVSEIRAQCDASPAPVLGSISTQLLLLRKDLEEDLRQQVFMSLTAKEINYYNQEQLFDEAVFVGFRSTRYDVAEAGNCFATGRYTACVFHCMRVVEKGLHALVRNLNARFNANIKFNKEIEYVNWGNIIEKIESVIDDLTDPNRKPRLDPDAKQSYSETAKEFIYFKNAWRDDVSHSRAVYDEHAAQSVMDHVKAFMIYLSKQGLTEE